MGSLATTHPPLICRKWSCSPLARYSCQPLSLPTVLACIGLVLADGRRTKFAVWAVLTAVAAPAIFYPTAFFLIEFFVAPQGGSFPTVADLAIFAGWFEIGFFGVLLGGLLVLRLCGYRLKRGRIAPAPLLQPCDRTSTADMAAAEGDTVVQDRPLASRGMLLRPRRGPDAGDTRLGVAGVDDLLGETAAGNRPRYRRGVEYFGGGRPRPSREVDFIPHFTRGPAKCRGGVQEAPPVRR